jgi:hypothetical protein
MASFGTTIDLSALARNGQRLASLAKGARTRVVARSIATLRRRLATETRKFVSEEYGISTRELGQRITTESTPDSVSVFGTTPRIPLIKFGGKYGGHNTAGATAAIIFGQRKTYAGAFLSKAKGNIVSRAINKATGKRYGRLPITVLHGPSPESMVLGGGSVVTSATPATRATALAGEIFAAEVDRLIDVELHS